MWYARLSRYVERKHDEMAQTNIEDIEGDMKNERGAQIYTSI